MNNSISTFFAKFMFSIIVIGGCLDLSGCSSIEIQYPDEIMQEMIEEARADNPDYQIEFNQFDRDEIKSCANITKIKSAKFCLLNVQRGSVKGLTVVLGACLSDDFEGRLHKVNC